MGSFSAKGVTNTTLALMVIAGISGCTATDLQSVNNGLAQFNQSLTTAVNPQFMQPELSPEETQRINKLVLSSAEHQRSKQLRKNIEEAAPVINFTLKTLAASDGGYGGGRNENLNGNCSYLARYAVPNDFSCNGYAADVYNQLPNTPTSTPLQVQSIGGWHLETRNAFTMSATFCSSISGACAIKYMKYINLGSGWQISALN
ncbi:MAG TPA: hypothetical protein PK231_07390 [Acidocella sp.]|nr:MAG: hypothetical protein B7Y53_00525 [Halothiobacillus sp. 28-55-5]HQT39233.1 hypothetical protein [Acidocella sp.]